MLRKIVYFLLLVIVLVSFVFAQVNCASPTVYENAIELKECLTTSPELLNHNLITTNLDTYSQIFGNKYEFSAVNVDKVSGIKYGLQGINHPKSGEILFSSFPEKTKFSIVENNILVDIPQNSEIDLASIGSGNIELKGDFKIKDPKSLTSLQLKSDGGLFSKAGDLTLLSGKKVELVNSGLQIVNKNSELLHFSPFSKSSFENSVSLNNNVLEAVSSTKGEYELLFKDKSFVLKKGMSASFSDFDFGERVLRNGMRGEDVKEVQKSLKYLGYDIGDKGIDGVLGVDTENAIRRFQKDYLGVDEDFLVDGIVGEKTKDALKSLVGKYPKVSTNGEVSAVNVDNQFNSYISNGNGELVGNGNYVLDSSGKTLVVEKDSGDLTLYKNSRKVLVSNNKVTESISSRDVQFDRSFTSNARAEFSKPEIKKAFSAGVYAESGFNAGQITADANSINGGYSQIALNPKQLESMKGQKVEYLYFDREYGRYKSKQILVDELLEDEDFMKKVQGQYNYFKKNFNNGKDYDALNPDENNKVMMNYVAYVLRNRDLPVTQENVLRIFNFHQTGSIDPNPAISSTYYNALSYLGDN